MSGNKKPRKKFNAASSKTNHIVSVLNRTINKFHIIGDMNHRATSFYFGEIQMHLKDKWLQIGLEQAKEFLLIEKRYWTLIGIFFFKEENGEINATPLKMEIPDTNLREVGRSGEIFLKQLRDSLYEEYPEYSDDNLLYYAYYLTHGNDLNIDTVESKLTEDILTITDNLTSIQEHIVELTEESVLNSLELDKFRIMGLNKDKTDMVLKETTYAA